MDGRDENGRKEKGRKGEAKPSTQAERRQMRLEQELRANLQKRKAQARSRRDDDAAPDPTESEDNHPLPDLQRGPRSD